VGFIQNNGSLWQTATIAAGTYTLSFKAAQGTGNTGYQQLRVTLRPSPGPTGVKTFVWTGNRIAEERASTGANVTKRFFIQGEQRVGGSDAGQYYYTRDHLGSVREVTDSSGSLRGEYDYGLWGNSVVTQGKMQVDFGYTGLYFHQPSGLNLALYRAYSATLARWISRDRLRNAELLQGPNLYAYVASNVVNLVDRLGLSSCKELCDMLADALSGLRARWAQVDALADDNVNQWWDIQKTLEPVGRLGVTVGHNPAEDAWEHSWESWKIALKWFWPAMQYFFNPSGHLWDKTAWEMERQDAAAEWAADQAAKQGCDCEKCSGDGN
jgi:RHS repeat-associated protein